ncbi:MAG: citrate synthase [Deltaproteobacteria bacterium CG11_big_fil_rev_8_21_14_0_20_47_16]|nr:MAG: citrate synthase [Deltaproteobacteria bacterium CG11_big_fil_rev_8_21_14_0_20_47_16]
MATAADPREQIIRGLEDVLVCESSVSDVDGINGVLTYRGYNIFDLAEKASFEEVSYLLLYGNRPTTVELKDFTAKLVAARAIPKAVIEAIKTLPHDAHPMAAMEVAVAALGCTDKTANTITVENDLTIGTQLISQLATITAAVWRIRSGKDPVAPDSSLSHAANFMYMMTGEKPTAEIAKMMDVALTLHADHEVPASTFAAMVVSSSLTDMYSSITAAIGSLKGSLHGGANENALRNVEKIGSPTNVTAYMDDVVANKKKVPGVGHRVYKVIDPRATILKKYAEQVSAQSNKLKNDFLTACELEKQATAVFGAKGLYPNVDFYSGILYHGMGISTEMFTPIFAVARITGWVSRLVEFLPQNRIFRPRALYTGKTEQKWS